MIKGVSSVDIVQSWEVVKEIDFTTVPAPGYTFTEGSSTGSATPELGNVAWTCRNLDWASDAGSNAFGGASSHVKFINGTGFQIYLDGSTAVGGNYYSTFMGNTQILCDISGSSGLVPDFDDSDTLCLQVLLTSSYTGGAAGQYVATSFVVSDGGYGTYTDAATTTGNFYAMQSYQETGAGATVNYYGRYGGGLRSPTSTLGDPWHHFPTGLTGRPSFYELVATPGSGWIGSVASTGSSGTGVTTFPDPLTTTEFQSMGNQQLVKGYLITDMPGGAPDGYTDVPQWALRPSNMKLSLSSRVGGVMGVDYTVNYTKLRVLRRPRHD